MDKFLGDDAVVSVVHHKDLEPGSTSFVGGCQ